MGFLFLNRVPVNESLNMPMILILLVITVASGTARMVPLKDFHINLIDTPGHKSDEPEYICRDSPVDISLIIDSSRSIYPFDFKKQMDFLEEFVSLFDIQPNKVRVAAVSFGQQVILEDAFTFNKYNNTKEVQDGLRRIKYRGERYGGGTNTASAIAFVRNRIFREGRPEAKQLCIVLTDGRSTNPRKTQEEAALIKSKNVQMVAIGIGTRISMEELKGIASSSDFVFTVDDYSLLDTIKKKMILKICTDVEIVTVEPPLQMDEKIKVVTVQPVLQKNEGKGRVATNLTSYSGNKTIGCNGPLDINFVFNPSEVGTRRVIKFIENTVTSKALANDDIRVGIITAPFPDMTGFRLNRYKNKNEIKKHFKEYGTNLVAPQLTDLHHDAFLPSNGGRLNARKLGIVFLRGKVDDALKAIVEATSAHEDGIEIYVITIGDMNYKVIINNIATDANYVIKASTSNDLPDLSEEFIKSICEK